MRKFLRYLRIAFSATCLIAFLLLIALWLRSYCDADIVRIELIQREIISVRGRLKVTRVVDFYPDMPQFDSYPVGESSADVIENHVRQYSNSYGFGYLAR